MSQHLWKVTAKKDLGKIAKGMNAEIIVSNSSRKPNQQEVITAINSKYGEKTALPGLSLSNFELSK